MTKLCPYTETCIHYESGDNKPPNQHVRLTVPCQRWLAMDCKKMDLLVQLEEWTSGKPVTCELEKIKRLRRLK